eukprot:GHVN01014654.1.p1 GENE.GHVN01014654.1~~GHVN01014654.1.p1  ORF type:complete len:295 (+),score=40.32 GHVN01014654.1:1511-2395(+)
MEKTPGKMGMEEGGPPPGFVSAEMTEEEDVMAPRIISTVVSKIIEVPEIEYIDKYVKKIEIVEKTVEVPKLVKEVVERIVEVPEIQIVEKREEFEEIHETIKYVPKPEIVEVPREVIKYVPVVETIIIEKVVEIPRRDGKVIEVPQPYLVEKVEKVPVYYDSEVACVVAQKLIPVLTTATDVELVVELTRYVPQVVAVDVYVPRPIQVPIIPVGRSDDQVFKVDIPEPQYNTLLMNLNPQCTGDPRMASELPFKLNANQSVAALTTDQYNSTVTIVGQEAVPFQLKKGVPAKRS